MRKAIANIISVVIPFRKTRRRARKWLMGNIKEMPDIIDALSEYRLLLSYAQYAEDVILYKYLHHVKNGFYVDVGAAHPVDLSVTKLFYDMGWSGINIEPRSDVIELYNTTRARDVNLAAAASNHQGTATLYLALESSSLNQDDARRQGFSDSTIVNMDTLRAFLTKHPLPAIHFLKIDVENHEKEVLEGMDFSSFRPWIVAIESTLPGAVNVTTHSLWENILFDSGYSLLAQHLINRYYVANEKKAELVAGALNMTNVRYLKYADLHNITGHPCPKC